MRHGAHGRVQVSLTGDPLSAEQHELVTRHHVIAMLARSHIVALTLVAALCILLFEQPRHQAQTFITSAVNTVSGSYRESTTPLPAPPPLPIPRKFWQTWKEAAQDVNDDVRAHMKTWTEKNPHHRYEMLTDGAAQTFVETRYKDQPRILDTFNRTKDTILRADLIRYLAVLADGGTYADVDTDCTKPIDEWIPAEYLDKAGLIVGVEYDSRGDGVRSDFKDQVQLCQWAFMAKPNNPILKYTVDTIISKLISLAPDGGDIKTSEQDGVLEVTGPRIWTHAILAGLSEQLGTPVVEENISMLDKPKLIGDVLFLTVNAFGSDQAHSEAKPFGNDEELLRHYWHGFGGWKSEHEG